MSTTMVKLACMLMISLSVVYVDCGLTIAEMRLDGFEYSAELDDSDLGSLKRLKER